MGRYESKARYHLEQIKYYHENAGPRGYVQAKYHYNELGRLQIAAQRSKDNKGDAGIIAIFREEAGHLMSEMKKWQDEWEQQQKLKKT
jgi:hypothetical protein